MNAGLSNLATLKAWLLPSGMVSGTDYDAQILAIGQGVAGLLEEACQRKFARVAGATFEFSADRAHVVVDRFPLESISAIALRATLADGYVDQGTVSDLVDQLAEQAGLVQFAAPLGLYQERVRLTYTGGFWFEQLEPTEGGYPTSQPSGSTAVPASLQLAWRMQCEHVWAQRDKLGLAIGEKPATPSALAAVELLPAVQQLLRPFIRYSLL